MALHEQCVGATDEWYTPPYVFEAMSVAFDLDVASPMHGLPWVPAAHRYSCESLDMPWDGFVWMNPPFGARNGLLPWLAKFLRHNNGVALVPDRTSAPWWQLYAKKMDAVLFVSPKIKFIGIDGEPGRSPAQGTSLLALGDRGCAALRNARAAGLGSLFVAASAA